MATRKNPTPDKKIRPAGKVAPVRKKRRRRNDEELIHDLQEKIRQVKNRQAAREMQKSPTLKAAMAALRSLDRGLAVAADEGDTMLRHVLADARRPLAAYLEESGFKLPKARLPRGRRPKAE